MFELHARSYSQPKKKIGPVSDSSDEQNTKRAGRGANSINKDQQRNGKDGEKPAETWLGGMVIVRLMGGKMEPTPSLAPTQTKVVVPGPVPVD